jgi:Protein of unknown function (DUF3455)
MNGRTLTQRLIVFVLLLLSVVACGTLPTDRGEQAQELTPQYLGPFNNPLWLGTRRLSIQTPSQLPAGTPAEILNVTATGQNGVTYSGNIANLLQSSSYPRARITAAFRTMPTPGFRNPLLPNGELPVYEVNAPAAQVYECQQTASGFTWTFIRPEAGLQPVNGTKPQDLSFEHFRYPGASNVPAGPSWRLETTDGVYQDLFVGQLQSSLPNGSGNIPLLRLIRSNVPDQSQPTVGSNVGTLFFPRPLEYYLGDHGVFVQQFLLRLSTSGGTAPSSGCSSSSDLGQITRVPYSTLYYFVQVIWAAY